MKKPTKTEIEQRRKALIARLTQNNFCAFGDDEPDLHDLTADAEPTLTFEYETESRDKIRDEGA